MHAHFIALFRIFSLRATSNFCFLLLIIPTGFLTLQTLRDLYLGKTFFESDSKSVLTELFNCREIGFYSPTTLIGRNTRVGSPQKNVAWGPLYLGPFCVLQRYA